MTDYLIHVPLLKKSKTKESFDLCTLFNKYEYHTIGRTHTLLFHKINDSLILLTWAKPLNQKQKYGKKRIVEAYNRKTGRCIVEDRRDKVLEFLSGKPDIPGKGSVPVNRAALHNMIPTSVVESLKFYTPKSARALNLITPFQIIVHCPVKNKKSRLALIEGSQFYGVDTAELQTTEDNQTT